MRVTAFNNILSILNLEIQEITYGLYRTKVDNGRYNRI